MARSFRPRQRSSRSPFLFAHRLFPLLLIVMLAGSVASQVGFARQMDTGQDDITEGTEEPVDQAPTEVPVTEEPLPTVVPRTEEPVEHGVGAIEINLWECPAEYDLTAPHLENLPLDCVAKPGIPIDVTDGIGAAQQRITGDDGDAHASFVNLATGQVAVGGPAGIAWCNGMVQHGGPESGYQLMDTSAGGFGWHLQDEEIVFCDWIVIASGTETAAGTARVLIQAYVCGPNVEFVAPYERTRVLADCPEQHPNMQFSVTNSAAAYSRLVSTSGAGVALFPDVPLGEIRLEEMLSDEFGNPLMYCGFVPAGTPDLPASYETIVDEKATFTLNDATQDLVCTVVNVPYNGDSSATGDLVINYRECPNTMNFATATDEELVTQCVTFMDGVVFGVSKDTSFGWISATGDNGSSSAFFDGASAPDQYNIRQLTSPKQLVVRCGSVIEGGPVSPAVRMTVSQATIQWVMQPNELVTCDWYAIVPDSAPSDVEVYVKACPPGADPNGPAAPFCLEDAPPVSITVTTATTEVSGITDDQDALIFRNTPSGATLITIPLPDGYEGATAACETYTREGDMRIVPSVPLTVREGKSILAPLGPNQKLVCGWNLIPPDATTGDNGRLVNSQYLCDPAKLSVVPTLAELEGACATDTTANRYDVEIEDAFYKERAAVNGVAIIENIPPGDIVIDVDFARTAPPRDATYVYCDSEPADQRSFKSIPLGEVPVRGGDEVTFTIEPKGESACRWYFVLDTPDSHIDVELSAWQCPAGATATQPDDWYAANCGVVMPMTDFRLTATDGATNGTTGANGSVTVRDQRPGLITIQEFIPSAHGDPVVLCHVVRDDGQVTTSRMSAPGGLVSTDLPRLGVGYSLDCAWYNILAGPGSITINLFTCEPGTTTSDNLEAACTPGPNGITFSLTDTSPNTSDQQSATGDATANLVMFGSLPFGSYTVTQQLPPDTASTFVWDCVGQRVGTQRPTPINTGPSFAIDLQGDENVSCSWFNIPADQHGRLTVIKYACSTPELVSDIDCEVYEDGQTFDLVAWDGDANWVPVTSGTTGGSGRLTFADLDAGQYWLDEQGGEWCHLTSDRLSADGNWIDVSAGAETIVKVYNCGATPGQPGKTPIKYPNTGVPVSQREDWLTVA